MDKNAIFEYKWPNRGDRGTLGHRALWDNGISWETPNGGILKIMSHDLRDTLVAILFSQGVAGSPLNVRYFIIFFI